MLHVLKKRLLSFRYALRGILFVLNEPNFRIHLFALFVVSCLGWYFSISSTEWLAILLVSGLVLVAEAINTAIEQLANKVELKNDLLIARTKDVAAGAVLLAALCSVLVGIIVFWKYIFC